MQESDFVKGLTDDGTPLTKAILSYEQGHAAGYQKDGGEEHLKEKAKEFGVEIKE